MGERSFHDEDFYRNSQLFKYFWGAQMSLSHEYLAIKRQFTTEPTYAAIRSKCNRMLIGH